MITLITTIAATLAASMMPAFAQEQVAGKLSISITAGVQQTNHVAILKITFCPNGELTVVNPTAAWMQTKFRCDDAGLVTPLQPDTSP